MRFTHAAERLARLPAPLPAGRSDIDPVLLAGPGGLPGVAAPLPDGRARLGAVLALVYPDGNGDASIVLIERTRGDYRHSGEVSFPGGAIDPSDASPAAAALREAREEVGLDPDQAGVRLLGQLDPVEVQVSGFRLLPVLGVAAREPVLVPSEREVAAIIAAPVDAFLPDAPVEIVETELGGRRLRFGAYPVRGYRVWGATARILGQLGALLAPGARQP